MSSKIVIPEIEKFKDINIIENLRDRLCGTEECNGKDTECTECAFYSDDNFNEFIKQVGL